MLSPAVPGESYLHSAPVGLKIVRSPKPIAWRLLPKESREPVPGSVFKPRATFSPLSVWHTLTPALPSPEAQVAGLGGRLSGK